MALTILVTGATAGFGAAMVHRFVRDGHRVIAAARRADKLEALRAELARFDISVLLVVPGMTRSDLFGHMLRSEARMKFRFDRGMPVQDVGSSVLNALRCNRTETVLGADARWMLRFNRFFPRWLDRLIAGRVRRLYAESGERPA